MEFACYTLIQAVIFPAGWIAPDVAGIFCFSGSRCAGSNADKKLQVRSFSR